MAEAGRRRAAGYDWSVVTGQLEALYDEAVAARPSIR
jgi:hypothetical protein